MDYGYKFNQTIEIIINELRFMIDQDHPLSTMEPLIKKLKAANQLNYTHAGLHPGNTILNYAIKARRVELSHYLLAEGADPDIINNDGMNALTLALKHYDDRFWRVKKHSILPHSFWDVKESDYLDLIEKILARSSNTINTRLVGGSVKFFSTPLHIVASTELLTLFLLLVSKGAALYTIDASHHSPLGCLLSDLGEQKLKQSTIEKIKQMILKEEAQAKSQIERTFFIS